MTNLDFETKISFEQKECCFECGEPITDHNRSSFIQFDMKGEHAVCINCSKAHFGELLVLDY